MAVRRPQNPHFHLFFMRLILPYGIRLGEKGKIETVPIAHVRIRSSRKKELPGIFVIDSGASTTLLPSADAELLGIILESGVKVLVRGVTGQLLGYRHRLTLDIEGVVLRRVPVIFAQSPEVPRVLGREGVFPRFGIVFDEARRRTAFLNQRQERNVINSLFFSVS